MDTQCTCGYVFGFVSRNVACPEHGSFPPSGLDAKSALEAATEIVKNKRGADRDFWKLPS